MECWGETYEKMNAFMIYQGDSKSVDMFGKKNYRKEKILKWMKFFLQKIILSVIILFLTVFGLKKSRKHYRH